jgi:hypothetical protein
MKDELQLKCRHDEELVKKQILHRQKIERLQLRRRKTLLLHLLEQKLFDEVRSS